MTRMYVLTSSTSQLPPGDKPPLDSIQPVDLADSLEPSMGSSLEVSLESSVMEETVSEG